MVESFTYFYSPTKDWDKLVTLWDKFGETGAINTIIDCIKTYAHDVEVEKAQKEKNSMEKIQSEDNSMDFEMINTQQ